MIQAQKALTKDLNFLNYWTKSSIALQVSVAN